jgi:hypothetical protein
MNFKRVFTFGCSFTSYAWPTWADIMVEDFKNKGLFGKNFGLCGSGNFYLFVKFMEAHRYYKFNNEDLIIFSWTSFQREDRMFNGKWNTPGNIFTSKIYTEEFKIDWVDPTHYAIRDCAIISNLKSFVNLIGAKVVTLSMSDLKQIDSNDKKSLFKSVNNVIEFYNEDITTDLPPMMEYLNLNNRDSISSQKRLKTTWEENKPNDWVYEWHPTVEEHSQYLNDNILPFLNLKLESKTEEFVNYWVTKIKSLEEPIVLKKTGWVILKNDDLMKKII